MFVIQFLKKKVIQVKNRFDVPKVQIKLNKDVETMAYLNKI